MTVSLAEATAAARRIQAPRSLFSPRAQDELREDARLLAGFVLAGDTERLREAGDALATFIRREMLREPTGHYGSKHLARCDCDRCEVLRGWRAALAEGSP